MKKKPVEIGEIKMRASALNLPMIFATLTPNLTSLITRLHMTVVVRCTDKIVCVPELPSLRYLHVEIYGLTCCGYPQHNITRHLCPVSLVKSQRLESLTLGSGVEVDPCVLADLPQLAHLSVLDFTEDLFPAVCRFAGNLRSLSFKPSHADGLDDRGVFDYWDNPRVGSTLQDIEWFDISPLSTLTRLESFSIANLPLKGFHAFPNSLTRLSMEEYSCWHPDFELGALTGLQSLHVACNRLARLDFVSNLQGLSHLSICTDDFMSMMINFPTRTPFAFLERMTRLETLTLAPELLSLFDVCKLTSLRVLDMTPVIGEYYFEDDEFDPFRGQEGYDCVPWADLSSARCPPGLGKIVCVHARLRLMRERQAKRAVLSILDSRRFLICVKL